MNVPRQAGIGLVFALLIGFWLVRDRSPHAAKPTTMMITRNTPPPLVGSNGKSRFATSTRAERASGGTMKIVNNNAMMSDKIAAAPARPL